MKALVVVLAVLAAAPALANDISGQVLDAMTRRPVAGAHVTLDEQVTETDAHGEFRLRRAGGTLRVRAPSPPPARA